MQKGEGGVLERVDQHVTALRASGHSNPERYTYVDSAQHRHELVARERCTCRGDTDRRAAHSRRCRRRNRADPLRVSSGAGGASAPRHGSRVPDRVVVRGSPRHCVHRHARQAGARCLHRVCRRGADVPVSFRNGPERREHQNTMRESRRFAGHAQQRGSCQQGQSIQRTQRTEQQSEHAAATGAHSARGAIASNRRACRSERRRKHSRAC